MATVGDTGAHAAGSIWDRHHAPLTIGIALAITMNAIEGLAMVTIAPTVADDLGGQRLYGWIVSAFMLASLIGTVIGGQEVDRRSPALVFLAGMTLFTAGGLLAALAPSMEVFLVARALQGASSGITIATCYAMMNRLYDDRLRPSVMAIGSMAYVGPTLIAPPVAGFVAEATSWRWVFAGMLIFVVPIGMMVLPRFASVEPAVQPETPAADRAVPAVLLAIATGILLVSFQVSLIPLAVALAAAALAGVAILLRRLMPAGTFRIAAGLPASILVRGASLGTFVIVETYMVYGLKHVGHVDAGQVGLLVLVGSITWSTGSWLQSRVDRVQGPQSRSMRMAVGVGSMIVGSSMIAFQTAVLGDIWIGWTIVGWLLTGFGIGFGFTTAAVVALSLAKREEAGAVSSSMLLGDTMFASVGVGVGGVLLALGHALDWSEAASVSIALAPAAVTLAIGAIAALRNLRLARVTAS